MFSATNPEARDCPYSGKFSIAGLKILQRNARSLIPKPTIESNITQSEDSGKPKRSRAHNHRKHKHISTESAADENLSESERKKKKYDRFLEKVFAKETLKKEQRLKRKMELEANGTLPFHNSSSEIESGLHNLTKLDSLRIRRSSGKADSTSCVNNEFTMLDIGCNMQESMEFHSSCDNKDFITGKIYVLLFKNSLGD